MLQVAIRKILFVGSPLFERSVAEPAPSLCSRRSTLWPLKFFAPHTGFCCRTMYAAAASPYVAATSAKDQADSKTVAVSSDSPPGVVSDSGSDRWRLYVIQSSQFAAKAMLALDTQQIPYDCIHVNAVSRTTRLKQLPTDSFLVPQVEIPTGEDGYFPVSDSTAILHAIDEYDHDAPGKLYPSDEIAQADAHISSTINAFVLYFNHVSPSGWERSIRAAIVSLLPLGGLLGLVLPLRHLYGSTRSSMREKVVESLGLSESEDLTDDKMLGDLIRELERYDAALDDQADYLYGFLYPTAADCALHAMISRFTDGMGTGALPAAVPQLWEVAAPRLTRLREWQRRMTERHPYLWDRYKVDNVR